MENKINPLSALIQLLNGSWVFVIMRQVCAFHTICNGSKESELFLFWNGGEFEIIHQIHAGCLDGSAQRIWSHFWVF